MERTLSIIKPDAVRAKRTGAILEAIEVAGLRPIALRLLQLSKEQAESFYAVHRDRPFFDGLVKFMTSGPVVVSCLEGEGAIEAYRALMGATDPAQAAEGTLRKRFATNIEQNACHGSDARKRRRGGVVLLPRAGPGNSLDVRDRDQRHQCQIGSEQQQVPAQRPRPPVVSCAASLVAIASLSCLRNMSAGV